MRTSSNVARNTRVFHLKITGRCHKVPHVTLAIKILCDSCSLCNFQSKNKQLFLSLLYRHVRCIENDTVSLHNCIGDVIRQITWNIYK